MVTPTRSRWPTSAVCTTYVAARASRIGVPSRYHRYLAVALPGAVLATWAVSVRPTTACPRTVGWSKATRPKTTRSVASDAAGSGVYPALLAVTTTCSRLPASAAVGWYVEPVALAIAVRPAYHW